MPMFLGRDVRRVYRLIKEGITGVDETADICLTSPEHYYVSSSRMLFEDPTYRKLIESALLASDDVHAIATLFGIEKELVEFYSSVYYNVTGLTPLQKVRLVEICDDPQEKTMKLWAVSQGLSFLAWRLGVKVDISPVEGMRSLYADSFFRAKEAFFNANSTQASREALKWAKQASESAKILKSWVSDTDAAKKDLEMALAEVTEDTVNFGNIEKLLSDNGETFIESKVSDLNQILKENSTPE